ncbi:hypothetical protein KCU65_g6486, partial [Aureobasidium melanogenum]
MFPEHYVRALEAQQNKLEAAVHTMYHRLLAANAWPGPRLMEQDGHPLLHDVLVVLGLLESENEGRAQLNAHQPKAKEPQPTSASGNESIVESPDPQYQLRRNSAPTSSQEATSQDAFHLRDQSNLSLPLVPEETRWFGRIPELLSRTTTGVHALAPPRLRDFDKPRRPTVNVQQETQSLPASFDQQQTFVAAEGSQSAAHSYPSLAGMDWNLLESSTDWWHPEPGNTAEQKVSMTGESSEVQDGPCELDGLWQSSKDKEMPQTTPPNDDQMDRELPTHFFKIVQTQGLPRTGDGPNTFVTGGVTITSPSVGIYMASVSRADGCYTTLASTIVVVPPSEVLSARGARALYDHEPFQYQDLNYHCQPANSSDFWIQDEPGNDCYQQVPAAAYFSGESAFNWDEYYPNGVGPTLTIGPNYRPYILPPSSMTDWANSIFSTSGCQIQVDGVWDPPRALVPGTTVLTPVVAWETATSATSTSTSSATPAEVEHSQPAETTPIQAISTTTAVADDLGSGQTSIGEPSSLTTVIVTSEISGVGIVFCGGSAKHNCGDDRSRSIFFSW